MRRLNAVQWAGVVLVMVWLCGCRNNTVIHYDAGPNPTDGGSSSDGTTPPGFCNQAIEESLCEGALAPTGSGCPFSSLSVKPNTPKRSGVTFNFDCTMCPGGRVLGIDGMYRLYEDDDLSKPSPSVYRETITFTGNHFVDVLEAVDPVSGKKVKVTAKGYYFCPDPAAYQGKMDSASYYNTVWVYTEVDPMGAFGIVPGATDPTFLGTGLSNTDIYIEANLYWDPNGAGQSSGQYCKVGSTLFGQECTNPFD